MIGQIEGVTGVHPELEKKPARAGKTRSQACPKCNSPGKLVGQSTFGLTICEQHRCRSPRCGYLWSALTQPEVSVEVSIEAQPELRAEAA